MYRFQKFVRRNKAKVIASGLLLSALLAGMAGTLLLTMLVAMATGLVIAPLASFIAPLIYGAEHLPVLLSRRSPT